jgi:hypothetical protein
MRQPFSRTNPIVSQGAQRTVYSSQPGLLRGLPNICIDEVVEAYRLSIYNSPLVTFQTAKLLVPPSKCFIATGVTLNKAL